MKGDRKSESGNGGARLTVGRTVHYTNQGTPSATMPAVVVRLDERRPDVGDLVVTFIHGTGASRQHGTFSVEKVPHSPVPKAGHWHWPERA